MILPRLRLTAGLAWHLRAAHDPDQSPLVVRPGGGGVTVMRRVGGEEPSATELARIHELLDRHEREPLELPRRGRVVRDYLIVVEGRPRLPVRGPGSSPGYRTRPAAELRVIELREAYARRGEAPPAIEIMERYDETVEV